MDRRDSWRVAMEVNMLKLAVEKLLSARFLLTIICGLTFAYLACKKILPNEATIGILILVFEAYFHRKRSEEENGGQK